MLRFLIPFLLISTAAQAQPSKPYKDGCSFGISRYWRTVLGYPPPWEKCCDIHDMAYEKEGSSTDRALADRNLGVCINRMGYPQVGPIYHIGTAILGQPLFRVSPRSKDWGDIRYRSIGKPD